MDHALAPPLLPAAGRAAEDTATAPPRRRPRGPVLIGDLSASIGGRPLWLMLWDAPDEEE